jgi:hypothetical protein
MTERKPVDDLKEGLGLLFRAARGIAKDVTPEVAEQKVADGARELVRIVNDVGRAIGGELEKSFGSTPPPAAKPPSDAPAATPTDAAPPRTPGDGTPPS